MSSFAWHPNWSKRARGAIAFRPFTPDLFDRPAPVTRLPEILLVPLHRPIDPVDNVFRLLNPVPFPGIADHYCIHTYVSERDVVLLSFRDWNIVVVLAVN